MLEGRISMEVIAEESSRIASDNRIKDDSNSCELLVEAYQRIRTLESENEDLLAQLANHRDDQRVAFLQHQLAELRQALRERDLKIENLEKISQKAILDYVCLENQLNTLKTDPNPHRRNVTPIPSQLNSPLNLSKINGRAEDSDLQVRSQQEGEEKVSVQCAMELLRQQEKLTLDRSQEKWRNQHQLFTFDKENLQRSFKSPEASKTLKNCFSEAEVNQLIKKVHRQEDRSQDKQKLKHYHNYCSSIEKKYSPNTATRKQASQLKKGPMLTIKHPTPFCPSYKNQRSTVNYNDKWAQTVTTNATVLSGNFFTGPNRLNFY